MWSIKKSKPITQEEGLKKAFITKLIGGLYTFKDVETKQNLEGYARGKLRMMRLEKDSSFLKQNTKKTKKDIQTTALSPKVGDYIDYDTIDGKHVIINIYPRKNEMQRPDVANIDQVLLVFSCVKPAFSFTLLDKFLSIIEQNGLKPILVVSKIDLITKDELESLQTRLKYYQQYYASYYVNSKERIGIDVLTHIFKDKLTVLAGQTGVGKSTLMNALLPELKLKTQEISKALGRGKHTTRHSQVYEFNEGYLADTPGFSKIDFDYFDETMLRIYFVDFLEHSAACKFSNKCLHMKEPGCQIKKMVDEGVIPISRYESYQSFFEEIKNKKAKY